MNPDYGKKMPNTPSNMPSPADTNAQGNLPGKQNHMAGAEIMRGMGAKPAAAKPPFPPAK